jgi:hypothetical protein
MPQPNYKNQNQKSSSATKRTEARRFSHDQDPIKAIAIFNSIVDKMQDAGYKYHSCIEISVNEKLLVFEEVQ